MAAEDQPNRVDLIEKWTPDTNARAIGFTWDKSEDDNDRHLPKIIIILAIV